MQHASFWCILNQVEVFKSEKNNVFAMYRCFYLTYQLTLKNAGPLFSRVVVNMKRPTIYQNVCQNIPH